MSALCLSGKQVDRHRPAKVLKVLLGDPIKSFGPKTRYKFPTDFIDLGGSSFREPHTEFIRQQLDSADKLGSGQN